MAGIHFWQRPWLDGAEEHYREDFDPEDLDEFEEPQHEDVPIDQLLEDQLSPPIEE